ncbi:RNA polymerase sigma-70 factor [Allokutzneria albata]|uniref:RNA polymerase sigma-70 factor, ECF subfamily n=1 Tax=Allokutzneria albata TaxID=211114 RepID=A0A1G9S4B2_ALLAB|nr:RNA polymerase sigma-70 factor [Allokutzneria albata]SDM30343.1 RNA polymerase sigma-70 factor, ECF subfamily [Allokutzneria albata]
MTRLDQAEAVFAEVRPRLFGLAYRMSGSVADAEDLVQEVWLRWQTADRAAVVNPAAYLATAITRLAINESQTARARRETYVGPWLPEPVDTSADPQLGAERGAALELAVLALLEKLSPTERAAYVLREAFDYPYSQIAEIVRTTEVAARQLVSRARKRLAGERRARVEAAEQRRLLAAFVAAAQAGDLAGLERLFSDDVVSYSDGGGKARAARVPLVGPRTLARVFAVWAPEFWSGAEVECVEANGLAAVALRREGKTFGLVTVTASGSGIDQVMWLVNPDKISSFDTT